MPDLIYTVYKITNTLNNKIYVGVHKTTNPNDEYMGSGEAIKQAILKYGKEHFTKEILFEYDNVEESYLIESLIVDSKFIKRKDTYNKMVGGIARMTFTDEHKNKISNALTGRVKSNTHIRNHRNSLIGYIHTDESKQKMSDSHQGKLNPKFNGYYITPWGKFESSKLASTNVVKLQTIYRWCKNNNIITFYNVSRSKHLQSLNESPIGKTFKEIGFDFVVN